MVNMADTWDHWRPCVTRDAFVPIDRDHRFPRLSGYPHPRSRVGGARAVRRCGYVHRTFHAYFEQDRCSDCDALSTVRERDLIDNPIGRDLRVWIIRRAGGRCELCGSTVDLQADHILLRCQGGTTDPDNLRCLCRPCNSSMRGRLSASDDPWAAPQSPLLTALQDRLQVVRTVLGVA